MEKDFASLRARKWTNYTPNWIKMPSRVDTISIQMLIL